MNVVVLADASVKIGFITNDVYEALRWLRDYCLGLERLP